MGRSQARDLAPRYVNGEKQRGQNCHVFGWSQIIWFPEQSVHASWKKGFQKYFLKTSEILANPVQRRLDKWEGERCCTSRNFGKFFKINLTIVLKPESLTSIEIYFSMKA